MNANWRHAILRTTYALAFGVCMMFIDVPEAKAHGIEIRPGFVEVHYGYARARHFPRWLRRNREFQHWYWQSHYRFEHHMNWHRLYHIYLNDRHHRWHTRRLNDHFHHDRGYRAYYKTHRKRNH